MIVDEDEDNELIYSCVIRMDDIHTLVLWHLNLSIRRYPIFLHTFVSFSRKDLPVIYFKKNDTAQVADFYDLEEDKKETSNVEMSKTWLRINDMTIESAEKYEMLSKRDPFVFDMTKKIGPTKNEQCKLPVMFFWLNKPIEYTFNKNTGAQISSYIYKCQLFHFITNFKCFNWF